MHQRTRRAEDRRVQKTLKLLREALLTLIAEKPYDSIIVKEILDRANVGRSTFYMHFRDKDELLISGIQDMLEPVPSVSPRLGQGSDRILWFSLPVFQHHYRHAHAWGDRIGARGRAILHEHLRTVLTDIIAEVIDSRSKSARKSMGPISPDLVAAYVASTFVLVLNWWLDKKMRLTPEEVNGIFRMLTLPTLAALC